MKRWCVAARYGLLSPYPRACFLIATLAAFYLALWLPFSSGPYSPALVDWCGTFALMVLVTICVDAVSEPLLVPTLILLFLPAERPRALRWAALHLFLSAATVVLLAEVFVLALVSVHHAYERVARGMLPIASALEQLERRRSPLPPSISAIPVDLLPVTPSPSIRCVRDYLYRKIADDQNVIGTVYFYEAPSLPVSPAVAPWDPAGSPLARTGFAFASAANGSAMWASTFLLPAWVSDADLDPVRWRSDVSSRASMVHAAVAWFPGPFCSRPLPEALSRFGPPTQTISTHPWRWMLYFDAAATPLLSGRCLPSSSRQYPPGTAIAWMDRDHPVGIFLGVQGYLSAVPVPSFVRRVLGGWLQVRAAAWGLQWPSP